MQAVDSSLPAERRYRESLSRCLRCFWPNLPLNKRI